MKTLSFFVLLGFIFIDDNPLQREVIAADKNLNALITRHQVAAAASVYADDFVLTTSSGKKKSKQDILNEIGLTDLTFEINETRDVQVRVLNETAILTGILHQKGTYQRKPFDNTLQVTDTWVLVDGNWKLFAGHATLLAQP